MKNSLSTAQAKVSWTLVQNLIDSSWMIGCKYGRGKPNVQELSLQSPSFRLKKSQEIKDKGCQCYQPEQWFLACFGDKRKPWKNLFFVALNQSVIHSLQNDEKTRSVTWCTALWSTSRVRDGWCEVTSNPKPICVCELVFTMTTSAIACQHHHPHSPFHQHAFFIT